MTRVVIATVAGAIVYYVWQMAAWMILPLHGPTVHELPNEALIREALVAQNLESGLYSVPFGTTEAMADPESMFMKNHKEGPIFNIFYTKDGSDPMPPMTLIIGFATDLLATFIVAMLLNCAVDGCCSSYLRRVGFVSAFGVFLALTAHVSYFNWMRFPTDYTLIFILDAVVGWTLVGIAVAIFVKPAPKP